MWRVSKMMQILEGSIVTGESGKPLKVVMIDGEKVVLKSGDELLRVDRSAILQVLTQPDPDPRPQVTKDNRFTYDLELAKWEATNPDKANLPREDDGIVDPGFFVGDRETLPNGQKIDIPITKKKLVGAVRLALSPSEPDPIPLSTGEICYYCGSQYWHLIGGLELKTLKLTDGYWVCEKPNTYWTPRIPASELSRSPIANPTQKSWANHPKQRDEADKCPDSFTATIPVEVGDQLRRNTRELVPWRGR
jgi:hypothetical protein